MPWSLTEFEKICDTKLAGSKVDTIHFEDVKLNPDTIISSMFKTMLDRVDPEQGLRKYHFSIVPDYRDFQMPSEEEDETGRFMTLINNLEEFTAQFCADVDDIARKSIVEFICAVIKIASRTLIQIRLRYISRNAEENQ